MTKVIAFPRVPIVPPQTLDALSGIVRTVSSSYSTVSSTLLLEGIDDLEQAIDKVALLVGAMPAGETRLKAEAELANIREQLKTARALSVQVGERG